ncbi:MAG: DUF2726 domain-containing protein [Clostridiales bacterium]|nr:DUF2726 domain-containing protein [Clostridiales bacterium]
MNRLLGIFVDTILPIIIIFVIIALGILIYKITNKKFDKPIIELRTHSTPLVSLKNSFCTEDEMRFLEAVHKSLPREFIAFPRVGVTTLIEPKGNLADYKAVWNKYVDICIFLRKDMKPILVVDLIHPSPVQQQMKKQDENVTNILKAVKIPLISKQIEYTYNIDDLRVELLNAMSNSTVAYLKEKIISDIKK